MATVGSLEALRELNRLRVIDALRRHGTASRSDLARQTGLSRTTVATLVSELQARGLVVEQAADGTKPGPAGRGRPPILLRLDPSAGAVVGIPGRRRSVTREGIQNVPGGQERVVEQQDRWSAP